jgi:hypothetical protein
MARLERAVIAGIAAYVLVMQVMLGAVANGAALDHALDGQWLICNGAPLAVPAPAPAEHPVDHPAARELCCVVPVLAATPAPLAPLIARPLAVLAEVLVAPVVDHAGFPTDPPRRARAPPIAA